MSRLTSAAAVAFAAVFAAAVQAAAQPAGPFEAPPARVTRGPALTAPSAAPATEVVRAYLRARGIEAATVDSLELVSEARAPRTGVTHARFVQRAGGWLVYGVYLRAAIDSRGRLTSVIENLVPLRGAPAAATAGEGQALGAALRHLYAGEVEPPGLSRREDRTAVFERTPFFHRGPRVTAVALPVGNALRAGYLVETWSRRGNLLHHTVVGGDGAVLGVELRTNADSYNIFPRDPGKDAQTVVAGPGAGNAESPQGWLAGAQTTINIAGNNANAYLDANADNAADAGGTPVNDGNFLAAANLAAQPSTPGNKAVAVQNLFYLNNVIHDRLYRHGFTEAAGNFQENNFGAGGLGGDSVNAEAQDGSGTDNANFATPADGSNPRMQMFLWTGIEPDHEVAISSPSAATYGAKGAEFGPALDTTGLAAGIALANDGAGVTSDACDRMPRNSLAGVIALVDRGTCTFVDKALNVQRAGAIGMIVANNADTAIFTMGGSSRRVRIPSLMISLADGTALKASLPATGTIRRKAVQPLFTDSSLDSDIVWHEYGHGLTWRMIGNMSGAVSGAIGEGMSDVLAIIVNDDDRVAEYSASDPIGIRRAPYGNYPNSYADFEGASVHNDGEIYAAAIWRLWETFKANALDADLLLDYLVDGMNYTPAGPTYEQMRDGILAAVAAAGLGHECHVWRAFADYGIGQGSSLRLRGPNVLVTESSAVPVVCTP